MYICVYLYIPFIYLEFSSFKIFNIPIKERFLFSISYYDYSDSTRYIFMYIFVTIISKREIHCVFHVSSLSLFIRYV